MVDVLHVPFEYYPDPVGGTEVYVAALCRELRGLDIASAVAASATADSEYVWEGIPVRRYACPESDRATRQSVLKRSFGAVLDRVRPGLVHFHALSPGIDLGCVEAARERNLPVVLTYHTPSLSCPRGTLMTYGCEPCDGRPRPLRCTACVAEKLSRRRWPGILLAAVPASISASAGARVGGRIGTALRLKAAVLDHQQQFRAVCGHAARVVAVCDWVREVLLRHEVPAERIVLSRQGLPQQPGSSCPPALPATGELRLCFFGRFDPTKGVELLIDALVRVPALPLTLDLYGVPSSPAYRDRLARRVSADPRIRLHAPVPSAEVVRTMQQYDAVLVPSQWLESGPLVVLEAWAAGRPVIGSRLGGIAELVGDGVNGWLLPARDPAAWAALFGELVRDRAALLQRAAAVRPPRTMADVATDMAALYREVRDVGGARG